MFDKQVEARQQHNEASQMDEGWWAAILKDDVNGELTQETAIKFPGDGLLNLDWDFIQTIHNNDEIIDLEVR